MYEYKAKLKRVVDGDTIDFDVDLGFGIHFNERFRLLGVNTPEIYGRNAPEQMSEGLRAKEMVSAMIESAQSIIIRTHKDQKEKYGRYLAEIILDGKVNLNVKLIEQGWAYKEV